MVLGSIFAATGAGSRESLITMRERRNRAAVAAAASASARQRLVMMLKRARGHEF